MTKEYKEKNNQEEHNEDLLSELSVQKKIKYFFDKYKIDTKERKIRRQKEQAKLELEKTKKELDRVVELERLAKEKLELEKKELEARREQAKIRAKQLEADKLRLEQEEQKIQEEQQRKIQEKENLRKLEEAKKAEEKRLEEERKEQERLKKLEEKRLEEERKEQERLKKAEEKRLEEERKEQERLKKLEEKRLEEERKEQERLKKAEEKRLEEERKEQERLKKAEEKRLEEEKIAKEREEKRKLLEAKLKEEELAKEKIIKQELEEKKRLEEERKRLLKQINSLEEKTIKETRETRKIKIESSNNEKELIAAQNFLFKKELQINEEKLKLEALNKKTADEKTKQNIEKKELLIANLLKERQILLKNLEKRKKELTKQNKTLKREEKIDGILSDFRNIKQEVIGENDKITEFTDEDGNNRNLFVTVYHTFIYYFYTKILKKDASDKVYVLKTKNNIKVKIALAISIAALLSLFLFFTLKITLSEKDIYGENTLNKTENKQSEKEPANENVENSENKENKESDKISNTALEEEVQAKQTSGTVAYYFPVDRTIKTKEKIHIFNSPNWNDAGEIVAENTEFNVNLITSPGGFLMYQIADGDLAGKFITANNKLVSIEKKNDSEDKFTNKPTAIRIVSDVNSYKDENLSEINASIAPNVILNIVGITKNDNNRLVYNISDGTFIPVDVSKIVEVQRAVVQQKTQQQTQAKPKNQTNNNRR